MLPNLGFVDTGNRFGPASYGTEGIFASVANQIAAMPSLHFGWALLVAIAVIRYSRVRLRWLALVHPILTLLVIVVTVNHYWLDGIVAALLVLLAFGLLALVPRRTRADRPTVIDLTNPFDGGKAPPTRPWVVIGVDDRIRSSRAHARHRRGRAIPLTLALQTGYDPARITPWAVIEPGDHLPLAHAVQRNRPVVLRNAAEMAEHYPFYAANPVRDAAVVAFPLQIRRVDLIDDDVSVLVVRRVG